MPSTCVFLPEQILAILRDSVNELQDHLREDALLATLRDNGNIEIGFDACIIEPTGAPPFSFRSRGIFLCRPGFAEGQPTRLDDESLHFLLGRACTLIVRHSGLSSHERLEIADAFAAAAGAEPAPVRAAAAATCGDTTSSRLTARLAPELATLDAALDLYLRSVGGTFLEGPIANLGLQIELAEGLLIGNASTVTGGRKAKVLPAPGRRPGRYQSAVEIADMLELYAQRVSPFRFGIEAKVDWDLVRTAHVYTFHGEFDRAGKVRTAPVLIRRRGRKSWLAEGLKHDRIAAAAATWSEKFDRDRWQDVHWLIRIGLAHLEFERIHPFADGNGRIGRLAMHLHLAETGKPLLPLEAAIWRKRQEYLVAIDKAITGGNSERFLRFLLRAAIDAIRIGQELLEDLHPIQRRLTAAIRENKLMLGRCNFGAAQLIGHLLLEVCDLNFVLDVSVNTAASALEKSGDLQLIDLDGNQRWVIPGVQDALKKAI